MSGLLLLVQPLIAQEKPSERIAKLREAVRVHESAGTPENPASSPEYHTQLLAHEILWQTGTKSLDELTATHPNFSAFLDVFLTDPQWMMSYLAAGLPIKDTPEGLRVLCELWESEATTPHFTQYRELTTALAHAWSVGPNAATFKIKATLPTLTIRFLDRFRLFRDLDQQGRLHPMFRTLKSWEMAYVINGVWSDEAFAWLNKNVNLPLERYPDACWAVEYKEVSDFGDTVQGPLFLRPWFDQMNEAQNTLEHGNVCGGLSTFGTYAAMAHGIPACAVGQPGHCAMAVRFARSDWRGGFGGPDGAPFTYVWRGNLHYLDIAEIVFSDEAGLHKALIHLARSHVLDEPAADIAFLDAVKASPLNLNLRREQITRMKAKNLPHEEWQSFGEQLLTSFGKHSHPAIDLCKEFDNLMFVPDDDTARLAWFLKVHKAAALASESWAWPVGSEVCEPQFAHLKSDASREKHLTDMLSVHLHSNATLFGQVLEWGISKFLSAGQSPTFSRAFSAAAGSGEKVDPAKLRTVYTKAIVAAEKARSIPAFHELSTGAQALAQAPQQLLEIKDLPPGEIVSTKGCLRPSSTSEWDLPITHISALGTKGGQIHTNAETNPNLIVELPSGIPLGGVLISKAWTNQEPIKQVKISTSTDGATWFPLAESSNMPTQWKVDAPPATTAVFIKFEVISPTPIFLHIQNFIVTSAPVLVN